MFDIFCSSSSNSPFKAFFIDGVPLDFEIRLTTRLGRSDVVGSSAVGALGAGCELLLLPAELVFTLELF